MVKHTTLHSRTAEIHRFHSLEMGMTNVTSNHNVPMIEQPTENTPDMYSLVDTTEKVAEVQVVDKSLSTSQRIVDSRLVSVDTRCRHTSER